jgi:NitT/TauT family transport system substrate-binding protein
MDYLFTFQIGDEEEMSNRKVSFLFLFILGLGLLSVACSTSNAETTTLKIAVLPILETLPMYVAEQEGFFEENGVNIEFVPVASGAERDQLITAGQADGMINEALSTALYNKDDIRVQIVRYARAATPDQTLFRILASGKSDIKQTADLKNVEIGISEGTIIEYLTDRLMEAEGIAPEEIKTVAVPKIPDRLALLNSGELKAAMLPEPLSSLSELQGAYVVLDDTSNPEYSFSVISFRKEVIDNNPQAIKGFLAAIEKAVDEINRDPEKWRGLLAENKLVPEPLMDSFQVPTFTTAGVPTEAQWEDVIEWAIYNDLISTSVSYSNSVTDEYLP